MDLVFYLLVAATASISLLLIVFSLFLIRIFLGKSLKNDRCPPVMATVFHQLFYFNRLHDYLTDFASRHRTFRLLALSHSELYTTDPQNIEHILKTNFSNYTKGNYNYTIVKDLFGNGIFAVDGDKWRQQRKLASFEFSTRVLRDFSSSVFRKNSAKLAGLVKTAATAEQILDIQDLFMKCTLDSIFEVGFGVELNCLGRPSEGGIVFMKAFDDANALVFWRYADFLWKIKRFLNIGSEARLKKNIKVIDDFVYNLILSKKEQEGVPRQGDDCNKKEDILSRFLVESDKDPGGMTDEYLRDIILNFMIAGRDSTASTLSWFFYMLCKYPMVQEKIAEEVREATYKNSKKLAMDEFASSLSYGSLDKMHYLHAALTETLRLYPAVPVDGKSSESNDTLPDGFEVKKGDGVNYLTYAMGRMTYIWGEDAQDFRPERWLENGFFQPETPFKFTAFNAGPRTCLGKEFAYRQMKIIAAVLLRFFIFEPDDGEKEVKYRTMFTLHINGGLLVRASRRSIPFC